MTRAETIAAIVLAGGRSSRFGRDKLAEPFAGRPLLDHAIAAVSSFTDEVLVIVAPDATPTVSVGVRLIHDAQAFEGPLAGVVAGLAATEADVVVIVAGDSPTIVPGVLDLLARAIMTTDATAARLEVGEDRPPLPMAVRRSAAWTVADALFATGERRLRALPEALHERSIPEVDWRRVDPAGATLRDIDSPADLV
jgi:molybdenum cofactor guanylyltransferase